MKQFTKSSHDKALFGVCGGIAEYIGISSFVVRFFFVFIIPASFWVYLFLHLVMKEKPSL